LPIWAIVHIPDDCLMMMMMMMMKMIFGAIGGINLAGET
jgi:hypothetical protein